jgi:hypothetical protein
VFLEQSAPEGRKAREMALFGIANLAVDSKEVRKSLLSAINQVHFLENDDYD